MIFKWLKTKFVDWRNLHCQSGRPLSDDELKTISARAKINRERLIEKELKAAEKLMFQHIRKAAANNHKSVIWYPEYHGATKHSQSDFYTKDFFAALAKPFHDRGWEVHYVAYNESSVKGSQLLFEVIFETSLM